MAEIPVSGRVLTWAREFRGLSLAEAADKLGITVAELEQYETEVKQPTLTKFEKFADAYRLPQATLFRKTPPPTPKMPKDFRTFDGAPPRASFEFLVALSNVRTLQSTMLRIDEEDDEFRRPVLREYDTKKDAVTQGENERAAIGISVANQLDWDSGSGFRHWRAIVEKTGIAVFLQKFDLQDCRGFSLWEDDIPPTIVINKADESENGRTFTLIHEYAHLLVRQPGISDLRNGHPIEAFCNRFAAAFLMPVTALRRVLPVWPDRIYAWDDQTIYNAARALNVSAQALVIRLEELRKAEHGLNRRFIPKIKIAKKREKSKVSYVKRHLSEIGGRYIATVMSALDREIIDGVQASQALALKPPHFDRAREYVARQAKLASAE